MLHSIFFTLFSPGMRLMGKISYFYKSLLILLFLMLPMFYLLTQIHWEYQQRVDRLTYLLQQLDNNGKLYRALHGNFHFEEEARINIMDVERNTEVVVDSARKAFLEANKALEGVLSKELFKHSHRLYNKLMDAEERKDLEDLKALSSHYRHFVYEQIIGAEALRDTGEQVILLFNKELAFISFRAMELKNQEDKLHQAMDLGALKLSLERSHRLWQMNESLGYISGDKLAALGEEQSLKKFLSLQLQGFERVCKQRYEYYESRLMDIKQRRVLLHVALLFSSLIGLYLFIASYINLRKALKGFVDTTMLISEGAFDSRVDIPSQDEMGLLATQFNGMIEHLDYHYSLLNEYKRAVDHSAIVLKTDLNGVITYVNEAYEKISGYSKDELIGSTHKLVKSKNTTSEQIAELWSYVNNKQTYKTIFENVAKNGKTFFVESTIFPIIGRDNEVSEVISIMFDITPLYRQKEKLQHQLYKDELTGLPNRLKLVEDIKNTGETKLVVINIDRFKEINTIYGENIGDLALQKMAKEIKHALNTRHLQLYKLPADEFAILAGPEISEEHFREDVTMLSHYLNHLKLECFEHLIAVRLTLGAAISSLNHTQRPLISIADMALKEAKRRMRPYLFYDAIASVDEDLEKNHKMIQLIDKAIKEEKVGCCYQGIFNAKTGKIEKYETLMRLEDDEGKQISAQRFVGIAKRSRYYPQLTRQVVQEAVYTFLKREESVSINLSIDDVMDDETYFYILDVLRNCECAQRIVFEFLETEEIEFNERIYDFITQVKKLGALIAIDDFGSGYSNYAYLMKLGVDILKIDASLIKEVARNEYSRLITKSIIDIAHALGMKTVAEHVHTQEIENILIEMGVDYMQGFYLHKPVCDL